MGGQRVDRKHPGLHRTQLTGVNSLSLSQWEWVEVERLYLSGFYALLGQFKKGKLGGGEAQDREKKAEGGRAQGVWLVQSAPDPVKEHWKALCWKWIGHYGFYGVTFKTRGVKRLYEQVKRSWRKWLNRRSRNNGMLGTGSISF